MFIYAATLYCEPCGLTLCYELDVPEGRDPENEHTWDSADYPKHVGEPGESDVPEHCAGCHGFMHNALTEEGKRFVADALVDGTGDAHVLDQWATEYCPQYRWVDPACFAAGALRTYASHIGDPVYALEHFEDAYRGGWESVEDYAYDLACALGSIPDSDSLADLYFDAEAFGRDLVLGGDIIVHEADDRRVHIFDAHV